MMQEFEANEFAHYLMKDKTEKKRRVKAGCMLAGVLFVVALVSGIFLYGKREEAIYTDHFYIVGSGTKYHQKECMYIRDRKDVRRLTREEFDSGKYEPCDACLPDQRHNETVKSF